MSGIRELIESKFGERKAKDSGILLELAVKGFEQRLQELYAEFQQGECSLEYLAEQLGLNIWEIIDILESKGLKTTNL